MLKKKFSGNVEPYFQNTRSPSAPTIHCILEHQCDQLCLTESTEIIPEQFVGIFVVVNRSPICTNVGILVEYFKQQD